MVTENHIWLLSFYRLSEINGSQFFANLAKHIKQPEISHNLSRHFAEEAQHAWYFSDCIDQLGYRPLLVEKSYQDYLSAVGLPANVMEILALTQIFERRVIRHYREQSRVFQEHPLILDTIDRVMQDEHWHLKWVMDALKEMEPIYGKEHIQATLQHYQGIDDEVHAQLQHEYAQRLSIY